jgi:hypothetical protein
MFPNFISRLVGECKNTTGAKTLELLQVEPGIGLEVHCVRTPQSNEPVYGSECPLLLENLLML